MGRLGSKTCADEFGEFAQSDLAIAELRATLGGGHGEYSGDETTSQPGKQQHPLFIGQNS